MASHSAVLSASKIMNPFWVGRLGNTAKVRQDTQPLLFRLWMVLRGSNLNSVIIFLTQGHGVNIIWLAKLAGFSTSVGWSQVLRHPCTGSIYKHALNHLHFVFSRYLEQLWSDTGIRPRLLWVSQIGTWDCCQFPGCFALEVVFFSVTWELCVYMCFSTLLWGEGYDTTLFATIWTKPVLLNIKLTLVLLLSSVHLQQQGENIVSSWLVTRFTAIHCIMS